MSVEVKVPVLPESVQDATIAVWHKKKGDFVKRDENILDLETDKVVLEVPAPVDGILEDIIKNEGDVVLAEELLATIKEGTVKDKDTESSTSTSSESKVAENSKQKDANMGPSARRESKNKELNDSSVSAISGTGVGGRVTKEDIKNHSSAAPVKSASSGASLGGRLEERVPMTRLRARIAERLVDSQQTTASLTTFNEVNLQSVMDTRKKYKDVFEKTHGIRLGFMSFFVKAAVEALKRFPLVNASIDGKDIIYHGYFDIGVAVSTERGLVVPIVRDADKKLMSDIEKEIRDFMARGQSGKLEVAEITGGTFTITNGGVFGSLLSTPILNPPQSAILGMQTIQERPVVENGQIVIRPMMYLSMSYDHRIVDGKDSVLFLKTIKELLEDPSRLLLEV
tara:strand:+ start:31938 stop:33128 length:1191 start_codon:yes stop_codon:yes gene_type:complete